MQREQIKDFTKGPILRPLLAFSMPILLALFLQALYGAVDLLVVGKYALAQDVSGVAVGSQIMQTVTGLVSSFAMGTTVLLGQKIGAGKREEGGQIIGTNVVMFFLVGAALTALIPLLSGALASAMNAPEEAFDETKRYIAICGFGAVMFWAAFFHGDLLCGIFARDRDVIAAGSDYLRAYGIDCLLTCFLFCFIGFFNGLGETGFVMVQGIAAAFLIRIPVAWWMSRATGRLFYIGLGVPCATVAQITACFVFYAHIRRKEELMRRAETML